MMPKRNSDKYYQYFYRPLFFMMVISVFMISTVKKDKNETLMQQIKKIFSKLLEYVVKFNSQTEPLSIEKLSLRFDLMQHERVYMHELVGDTCRIFKDYPLQLRAKIFRKALKTPSGLYSDFYLETRFLDFFDSSFGAMGNRLLDLADNPKKLGLLEAEFRVVRAFYQFLFDAFNKEFISDLDQNDIEYQQRFLSSFKYGQEIIDNIIDTDLKEGLNVDQLIKIKSLLTDLFYNATISFK